MEPIELLPDPLDEPYYTSPLHIARRKFSIRGSARRSSGPRFGRRSIHPGPQPPPNRGAFPIGILRLSSRLERSTPAYLAFRRQNVTNSTVGAGVRRGLPCRGASGRARRG